MGTRQAITQLASTTDEGLLRFRLQMAEQSRRFGERLTELRQGKGWKQKHVVAAMAEAGDLALNTNQLSRYENGGAYPNEARMERFAEVFEVEVCDLVAPRPQAKPDDLMESLNAAQQQTELPKQVAEALGALAAQIGEKMDKMSDEIEELRQLLKSSGRTRKSSGS